MSIEVIGVDSLGRHHFKGLTADAKGLGSLTDANGNTVNYVEGSTYLITDGSGGEQKYCGPIAGWISTVSGGAIIVEDRRHGGEFGLNTSAEGHHSIPRWKYTIIDHADTSPVAVSGGVPAIYGGAICVTEDFAGTPEFQIRDDTTFIDALPTNMVQRDASVDIAGVNTVTDLNVNIAVAGTAGKILIKWWPLNVAS